MAFRSFTSYEDFRDATLYKNRYIHDEKTMFFLNEVLATSESENRQVILNKGHVLWRARLGNDPESSVDDEDGTAYIGPQPYSEIDMKPLYNSATEGRANPKGIPYLYLATDENTAMSEVRPWIGSKISVGRFKISKELQIIECADFTEFTDNKKPNLINKNLPNKELITSSVWANIDKAFSEPVTSNNNKAEYVPTQIIAEFFKSKGFDGIAYKSSLSTTGANIVLFNLNMADFIDSDLYEVKSVKFDFEEVHLERYFVPCTKNV